MTDNRITVTVEDLPPMTLEQADELRRRLKRAARDTVEAFVLSPAIPAYGAAIADLLASTDAAIEIKRALKVDDEAVARILADPVGVRELQRPDGIIVIEEGEPIPSAATLNEARAVLRKRRMTQAEFELEQRRLTLEPGERAELVDCGAQIAILRNDGSVTREPTPGFQRID